MLIVDIKNTRVETRRGEKNGKAWEMSNQVDSFLHLGEFEIIRFPILLDSASNPYPPGVYQFDVEKLVKVGQYGLELDRFAPLGLVPVQNSPVSELSAAVSELPVDSVTKPLFASARANK